MSRFNIFYGIKLAKTGHISSMFIWSIRLIILFSLFSTSVLASANDYDKGALYFARGDYLSALSLWKPLAKEGNSAAFYSIGLLYDQEKEVNKNAKIAQTYIQAAVDKNLPVAQYYLGMKYFAGLDVKKTQSLQMTDHPIAQYTTPIKTQASTNNSPKSQLSQNALRFKQLNDDYYSLQIITAKQYESISQLTNVYTDELTYFLKIKKALS